MKRSSPLARRTPIKRAAQALARHGALARKSPLAKRNAARQRQEFARAYGGTARVEWWPAAATELHLDRPQDLLLITGVSSAKTRRRRSRHALPGRCYREAGWTDLPHRPGRADVWLQFNVECVA